jgi:hypothetical protein
MTRQMPSTLTVFAQALHFGIWAFVIGISFGFRNSDFRRCVALERRTGYPAVMIHENLLQSIDGLSSRIIAIRDSL